MSMENVTPASPPCPTCGKKMKLTGHSPACESMIYDFLCSDDGDRLIWRRCHTASNKKQFRDAVGGSGLRCLR